VGTKKIFGFAILGVIIFACLIYIIWGKRGILEYRQLKNEIQQEQEQIQELQKEIEKLQNKIDNWKSDEFDSEKFARQDMQMGKPGEQVFVLTDTNKR
jgi:cell division protein FtsB